MFTLSSEDAVKALHNGNKITNSCFRWDEYIHLANNRYEFENGKEVPHDWLHPPYIKVLWKIK